MTPEREAELETMLLEMSGTAGMFYSMATRIGNHPFIEFTGLMNEYILLCRRAKEDGIDFTECNIHSGQQLPMAHHNIKYAMEKIECIYSGQIELVENG